MTVLQFVVIEYQSVSIVNRTAYMFVKAWNSFRLFRPLAKYEANTVSFINHVGLKIPVHNPACGISLKLIFHVKNVKKTRSDRPIQDQSLWFQGWFGPTSYNFRFSLENDMYYKCSLTKFILAKCLSF